MTKINTTQQIELDYLTDLKYELAVVDSVLNSISKKSGITPSIVESLIDPNRFEDHLDSVNRLIKLKNKSFDMTNGVYRQFINEFKNQIKMTITETRKRYNEKRREPKQVVVNQTTVTAKPTSAKANAGQAVIKAYTKNYNSNPVAHADLKLVNASVQKHRKHKNGKAYTYYQFKLGFNQILPNGYDCEVKQYSMFLFGNMEDDVKNMYALINKLTDSSSKHLVHVALQKAMTSNYINVIQINSLD